MKTKKKTSSKSLVSRAAVLGSSLVYLGQGVADDVVTELEKTDFFEGTKGKKMAEEIRSELKDRKEDVKSSVKKELKKVIKELGIATTDDLKKARQ